MRGILRYFSLRIRGKDTLITGNCKCCSECCRLVNLRGKDGWIKNEKQFQELIVQSPVFSRFTFVSKDHAGYLQFTCSWLKEDGVCKDYDQRLDICRNYPSKSMVFHGGKLLSQCGYQITEVVPFKKILDKKVKEKNK